MSENHSQIDDRLSKAYNIQRPSYNKDSAEKLKVLVAKRLSENPEWKKDWLTEDSVIRFLKAFLTVEDTLNALDEYCNWRRDEDVDAIGALDVSADQDMLTEQAKNRDHLLHGHYDRCGRPILVIDVRNHDKHHSDHDALCKYFLHVMESINAIADDKSFDKRIVIIFNLRGFGMKNMDYKFIKQLLHCLMAYYPERIGMCFIINYPWVFFGCWKLIRLWMNDVTRSKFIFAGKEQVEDFIDLESLPFPLFGRK